MKYIKLADTGSNEIDKVYRCLTVFLYHPTIPTLSAYKEIN